MYVCMYIHVYVCVYVCMYVCMYVYIYTCVCVCMYVCVYVCVCMCVCVSVQNYLGLAPASLPSDLTDLTGMVCVIVILQAPPCLTLPCLLAKYLPLPCLLACLPYFPLPPCLTACISPAFLPAYPIFPCLLICLSLCRVSTLPACLHLPFPALQHVCLSGCLPVCLLDSPLPDSWLLLSCPFVLSIPA